MTMPATVAHGSTSARRLLAPTWARPVVALAASTIVMLLLSGAYLLGADRSNTHFASGVAYSTATQISIAAKGWTYSVSLDVPWTDSGGKLNHGTRPACLPAVDSSIRARFAWVPVYLQGTTLRAVVWVDCRS